MLAPGFLVGADFSVAVLVAFNPDRRFSSAVGYEIGCVRIQSIRNGRTLSFRAGRSGERPAYCCSHSQFRLGGEHGSYFCATNSLPQLRGDRSMATQAQSANVIQVAFPSTFRHRQNMIGIPQTLTHPPAESPVPHQGLAPVTTRSFQVAMLLDRVETAMGANPAIALQDLLP